MMDSVEPIKPKRVKPPVVKTPAIAKKVKKAFNPETATMKEYRAYRMKR